MQPMVLKFINKQGEYRPEDIEELRRTLADCGKVVSGNMTIEQVLYTRVSLEMIAAIQRFDKASGEMVQTTIILNKRIYVLTWVVLVVGTIQTAFTVLGYFK